VRRHVRATGVEVVEDARLLPDALLAENAEGKELVRLSQAHSADFEPPSGTLPGARRRQL
jgi:hypothetical protein